MCTKFPPPVMVLGIVSHEGRVITPYFFPQGLRVNATARVEVLEAMVKPWIKDVTQGQSCIFQ